MSCPLNVTDVLSPHRRSVGAPHLYPLPASRGEDKQLQDAQFAAQTIASQTIKVTVADY